MLCDVLGRQIKIKQKKTWKSLSLTLKILLSLAENSLDFLAFSLGRKLFLFLKTQNKYQMLLD